MKIKKKSAKKKIVKRKGTERKGGKRGDLSDAELKSVAAGNPSKTTPRRCRRMGKKLQTVYRTL